MDSKLVFFKLYLHDFGDAIYINVSDIKAIGEDKRNQTVNVLLGSNVSYNVKCKMETFSDKLKEIGVKIVEIYD